MTNDTSKRLTKEQDLFSNRMTSAQKNSSIFRVQLEQILCKN